MLDERYVPMGVGGEAEPLPPPHPTRLQAFLFACGEVAAEEEVKLAGGNVPRQRPARKKKP